MTEAFGNLLSKAIMKNLQDVQTIEELALRLITNCNEMRKSYDMIAKERFGLTTPEAMLYLMNVSEKERIKQMPNWCFNVLTITPTNGVQKAQLGEWVKGFNNGFLNAIMPKPDGLTEVEEMRWCEQNWGTDREIDGGIVEDNKGNVVFRFNSAWSPPVPVYGYLWEEGYDIEATWEEPSMEIYGKFKDGRVFERVSK